MDYSEINDHEHGGSPWNSSPRQAPSGFGSQPDSPSRTMNNSTHEDVSDQDTMVASARQLSEAPTGAPGSPEITGTAQPYQQTAPQAQYQQPQSMPKPSRPQQQQSAPHRQQRPQPKYKLQAKITGLEGTGKKDMIVRFDVHTDLPRFRTTQFRDVRRTHAEFKKLADYLISSNPEAMVPAVPAVVTSAGAGTEENEARVKYNMQRWLNAVCSNEILMRDDEMIFFVESDFGYSPVVRLKQPATGVRRKYLKQFAPPPDNTPELYEARPVVKMFYLGSMDAGQKVANVVKARRGSYMDVVSYILQLMHYRAWHR